MSQVDVVTKSPLKQRTHGMRTRMETFVRDFEWTWTSAVSFSFALVFFLLITSSVMPSFWMYFAEQTLGWGGPTDLEAFLTQPFVWESVWFFDSFPVPSDETLLQLRDAIAMGLTTGPIITVLVVAAAMQNWRKKLRGGSGDTRPTGGYR
ncbi:MAG: hypothetical protein ACXWWX_03945 [Actinomycetota bacterium]